MENKQQVTTPEVSLKANSVSKTAVTIMAISSAAPAMCMGGSMGTIMAGSGTAAALAFLIATIAILLVGISYGSLSERYNSCGGTYSYISNVFGEKAGFWTAFVYFGVTVTTSGAITTIFSTYINYLFPAIPMWVAFFFLVIPIFLIDWRGVELTSKALIIVWVIQMVLLIWPAIKIITMAPEGFELGTSVSNAFTPTFGLSGLMAAVLVCVWSYVGFEAPAYMGEELKGGAKSVKFAIIVSGIAIGVIYVVACWVWTATMSPEQLDQLVGSGTLLADYTALVGYAAGDKMVALATIVSCVGCFFGFSTMMSRFMYDLGRTGYLPKFFTQVNKYQTPSGGLIAYCSIAFFACLYGCYAYSGEGLFGEGANLFDGVNDIFTYMSICASIAYAFICLANMKDRMGEKGLVAVLKYKAVPVFTFCLLVYMIFSSGLKYNIGTLVWMGLAAVTMLIFFSRRKKNA